MDDKPENLLSHIIALRKVLVNSCFAIFIAMILAFIFIDQITEFVAAPLLKALAAYNKSSNLIYTSITELFSLQLKLSFYTSLAVCFPYILYQFWTFIKPGLKQKEIDISKKFILLATGFFFAGMTFAFYIVIPNIFKVFLTNVTNVDFLPRISENISFIIVLMISFGISFQLPILIYILDRLKILRISTLRKLWREIILAIVVLSALITPPDPMSMAFLAAPLIILYFLSLVFCSFL